MPRPVPDKAAYPAAAAPCPYFGACGGCTLQDLAYTDQVALKRERLRRALAPLGPVPPVDVVPMPEPWRYRNRAEFTFSQRDGALQLGFHEAGSFRKVVDLEDCLLLPESLMRIVRSARALAADTGLSAYHPRTHQGFFRYLLARHSALTRTHLVCLVTAPGDRAVVARWAQALRARHPDLASVFWGTTSRLADVAVPDALETLAGEDRFEEAVGPWRLALHPFSFLQSSTAQADRMYATLLDWLPARPAGVAWDLYCGAGVIALYLGRQFGRVYGIDVVGHHVALARENAARHGLTHVQFQEGKTEELLLDRRFWLGEAKPDVVVVDPPRAGLHLQALNSVLAARPTHLGYVSCQPQALARDAQLLGRSYPRYRLTRLAAFDLFPQTDHLETVALFER